MPIVRIPGRGDVRFPDNMTPYQIQLAIEREILPGRKPEAISAPKRPEGGVLTSLQGIGSEISAQPSRARRMVEEIAGAAFKSPVEKAREAARIKEFGPIATRSRAQQEAAEQETETQLAAPEFDTMLGRGLYSGTSSLIQNLPGLVASVATLNPLPALANIAATTAPTAYQKYRERGGTIEEAALGSGAETGVELATEALPLGFAVKTLGKVGFGQFLRNYLGRELPSEAVATITQNAIDTAIANPDKTWADYVNELPAALGETAIATLVPGTVLAGASKVAQTLQREPRAATEETGEEPGAEAGATSRRPSPPPPPPADMGALSKALGPVGGKVTLQEPSGPQEYTYQGLDEDGSVLLADPNGNVFAEDPAQISAAMKVGAIEPKDGLGAVAFGEDVTEGLPPVRAEAATVPVAGPSKGPAPGFVRVYHGGSPLEPNETGRMFTTSREYAEGHASEFPGAEVLYTDLPENDPRITPEYPEQGPKQGFTFNPQLTAEEMKGVRSLGAGPLPTAPVSRIFQPSGQPAPEPEPAPPPPSDDSRIFKPSASAPVTAASAVESIAAPEQMPIDEDVGPYLQEYSKFRTAKQILEIEDNARAIAAKRGASSVSRKDIFQAAMAFDDALFKEPSPAPARARVPAPVPAPTPTVEPAPKAKAEPYRPDKREPAVVWENFNKAFETQEYPSVNWAIGSDWGMGTSSSIDTPEGYRRAATERMERLYGPDPTATTAPEPVTEQTLRDAGFTSGEIASWRSGQGSKDYAEKAGRGFIYYKGDFTPATAENVAEITSLIEADIAKNAATRERLIATDTGKRTVLVGDARPQLLAENLKDLETSDSKLKAQIEGLNRQLERSTKAAAPKPVTEEELDLGEEEIDYDEHPLMQEHEIKYDNAIDEIGSAEYMKELRKLITRFKREGLIDEDDVVEIDERILDVEKTERLEEGMAALEDALNNQRDNQREDVEERIREEVEATKTSEVQPGSLVGGVRMDIDKYRGGTLSDLLEEIFANFDNKFSQYDMYLAGRISTLLSEAERAGLKVKLYILQKGDLAPPSIARGSAYGLVDTDLKNNTIDVYLRSPSSGENSAGNTSEVVLHEALHAVSLAFTLGARKGRSLTPKAEKFVNDLNGLYSAFVSHFNKRVKSGAKLSEFEESILKRRTNALVDPDEFLTWGMTNANAQEYLRGIEAGPGQNLFQRFVAMFKSMLGIPDGDTSALSRLIEIINPLFEATEADYKAVMGTPATGTTPAIGSSKARNQISEILKFGSPADMKDAIADLEKPDDKVMNERANLQKQNRGCD